MRQKNIMIKNNPPFRRFARFINSDFMERIRNVLPACLLGLLLGLSVPLTGTSTRFVIPEEIPDTNTPESDERARDLEPENSGEEGPETESVSVSISSPVPDRIRLLSTAGERWERIRAGRESGRTEALVRAVLNRDRVWQLSSTGMRMEELEFQARRNEKNSVSKENMIQFALHDDVIYAFTEEEETEANRWVVIDNAVSGGNAPFSARENAERVYSFAREVLGVNTAAACGILANIQHESGFNPQAVFIEADGRISYGICQWNAGRLLALQNYCEQHGYDAASLSGQLQYLQYELTTRERAAFYRVRSVPDTGNGAYEAGYNWARYFERCADRYYTGRAETAYLTYWTKYGNANESFILSVIGETFPPTAMETGSAVDLRGVIRSDAKIIRVSAFISDTSGNIIQSHEQSWNSGRYDLETDGVNHALRPEQLPPGDYIYTVRAADLSGSEKTLIESAFTVGSTNGTRIPLYAEVPGGESGEPESNPDEITAMATDGLALPDAGTDSGTADPALADTGADISDDSASGVTGVTTGAVDIPDVPANAATGTDTDFDSDTDSNPAGQDGEQMDTAIAESPISDEEWAAISQEGYWQPVIPQNESDRQNDSTDTEDTDETGTDESDHSDHDEDNHDDNTDTDSTDTAEPDGGAADTEPDGGTADVNPGDAADINPEESGGTDRIYTEPASPHEPGTPPSAQSGNADEVYTEPEKPHVPEDDSAEAASESQNAAESETREIPSNPDTEPDVSPDSSSVLPEDTADISDGYGESTDSPEPDAKDADV